MYFWNINSLKNEIVDGKFSDRKVFPYVVVCAALYAAIIEFTAYLPYEDVNNWTYTLSALNILVALGGTVFVYYSNGGANGKDFASKYFGIGFVISIRFLVYLIPLMILMMVYWIYAFEDQETIPTTPIEVVIFTSWYALLYFRIGKHVNDTAKA